MLRGVPRQGVASAGLQLGEAHPIEGREVVRRRRKHPRATTAITTAARKELLRRLVGEAHLPGVGKAVTNGISGRGEQRRTCSPSSRGGEKGAGYACLGSKSGEFRHLGRSLRRAAEAAANFHAAGTLGCIGAPRAFGQSREADGLLYSCSADGV